MGAQMLSSQTSGLRLGANIIVRLGTEPEIVESTPFCSCHLKSKLTLKQFCAN